MASPTERKAHFSPPLRIPSPFENIYSQVQIHPPFFALQLVFKDEQSEPYQRFASIRGLMVRMGAFISESISTSGSPRKCIQITSRVSSMEAFSPLYDAFPTLCEVVMKVCKSTNSC